MISSVEESAFYETTVPATSFWINIAEQFSNDNVDAEFEVDDKRAYLKWKTEAGVAPPPANTGGLLVIQILLQKVDSCNSHAPPDLCKQLFDKIRLYTFEESHENFTTSFLDGINGTGQHLWRYEHDLDVLRSLGLQPGPRLVRGRRRAHVQHILWHPVRVDVLWRDVGDQYWRLRRIAHGQRHGQLENQVGS